MLGGHAAGQFVEVIFEEDLEPEQDPRPLHRGRLHPAGKRLGRGLHRLIDDVGATERRLGDHLTDRRVMNGRRGDARHGDPLPANEERAGQQLRHGRWLRGKSHQCSRSGAVGTVGGSGRVVAVADRAVPPQQREIDVVLDRLDVAVEKHEQRHARV